MPLSTYYCKSSGLFYFRRKFYVSTTTGHVCGDCDCTGFSGLQDYLSLALMKLGIQHIVLQPLHLEHAAEKLGDLH